MLCEWPVSPCRTFALFSDGKQKKCFTLHVGVQGCTSGIIEIPAACLGFGCFHTTNGISHIKFTAGAGEASFTVEEVYLLSHHQIPVSLSVRCRHRSISALVGNHEDDGSDGAFAAPCITACRTSSEWLIRFGGLLFELEHVLSLTRTLGMSVFEQGLICSILKPMLTFPFPSFLLQQRNNHRKCHLHPIWNSIWKSSFREGYLKCCRFVCFQSRDVWIREPSVWTSRSLASLASNILSFLRLK